MTFTVWVKGKGGKPVADARVTVRYDYFMSLEYSQGETGPDGTCTFSTGQQKPGVKATISVNGRNCGQKVLQDDGNYTVHYHG